MIGVDQQPLVEEAPESGNTTAAIPFCLVACTEATQSDLRAPEMLTRPPRFCHESEKDAEREAVRLATKYPGYEFAVLRTVAVVKFEDGRIRWTEPEAEGVGT